MEERVKELENLINKFIDEAETVLQENKQEEEKISKNNSKKENNRTKPLGLKVSENFY